MARLQAEARRPDDPRLALSPLQLRFFLRVLRRHLRSSFHAVRIARPGLPPVPPTRPLVLYCNHPSWWDAALVPVLCAELLPRRRVFAPIDIAALERYPFMRRLGFFGISPGTHRGAAAFLRIGRSVLEDASTLFGVTPEGAFTDPRLRPLQLQPGLAALLERAPPVTVLPLAIEYPFWNERRPEALVRFGPPMLFGSGVGTGPAEIAERLRTALTETMDALAADAASRDPARFDAVLTGHTGISGIYDAWRHLRALLRGRRFDPAHGASPPAHPPVATGPASSRPDAAGPPVHHPASVPAPATSTDSAAPAPSPSASVTRPSDPTRPPPTLVQP